MLQLLLCNLCTCPQPSLYFHREEVISLQRFCQTVLSEDLNLSEDDDEEMIGHLTRELEPKPLIMQDDIRTFCETSLKHVYMITW